MPAPDSPGGRLTVALDWLVDVITAGFASWTVVYWVCAAAHIRVVPAVIAWVLTLPVCVMLVPRRAAFMGRVLSRLPLAAAVAMAVAFGCALLGGIILVREASFSHVRSLAGLAAVIGICVGVVLLVLRARRPGTQEQVAAAGRGPDAPQRVRDVEAVVILALAVAAALLSLFIVRPDADDIYYVNRSTYIAQHGSFPLLDTLYSDQRWPASETPPVSAFEPFLGAIGTALHLQAPQVTYLLFPPIASVLMVLVMWRLLRVWGVRWAPVAVSVALVFLLWGGVGNGSFGNLSIGRMWQGKVVLVCIGIPLMYAQLLLWRRDASRRRLLLVLAAGLVAVGLSSTGVLEAPLVAVAAAVPALVQRQWRVVLGSVVLVLPAIGVAILVHAVGGLSPGTATPYDLDPASQLVRVTGGGAMAVVAVLAMFAGWIGVRRLSGRLTVASASALVVVLLAPGVLGVLNRLGGAGPVLWRMLDVVPAAALVGAMAVLAMQTRSRWSIAGATLPVAGVALMVATGLPIWSSANGATLVSRPTWKLDPQALATARVVIAHAAPGSEIAAPPDVSGALAVATSLDHAVDPRSFYLGNFSTAPGFDTGDRQILDSFTVNGLATEAQVIAALRALQVDTVCLWRDDPNGVRILGDAGYQRWFVTSSDQCFRS